MATIFNGASPPEFSRDDTAATAQPIGSPTLSDSSQRSGDARTPAAESIIDRYPVGVPRRLAYPDMPAWGLLHRAASLIPGRAACVYNDVEWTWEELNLDAIRTADCLRRLGVEPGDRVGILLPNIPEYLIALNGIWRAEAIAVALSPMAVPEEVDRMLASTDCKVVICLDMLVSLISGEHRPAKTLLVSLRPRLPLFEQLGYLFLRKRRTGVWWMSASEHVGWFWEELGVIADGNSRNKAVSDSGNRSNPVASFSSHTSPLPLEGERARVSGSSSDVENTNSAKGTNNAAPRPPHPPFGHLLPHGGEGGRSGVDWATVPAYILPTGGTTGEPKAVTLSHRNMVANAWQQYYWAGASVGQEKLLALLPFFHSYGLSTNVMGGAAMVATLIMDHRFNVRKAIRLIEEHRPTVFHAVPAMLVAMNEHLRTHKADLTSLKWVISGGAPLPEVVGREFAEHAGALVVEGYGLSEASPVTHVGPLDGSSSFGTIGLPLPNTECRIVDSETGTHVAKPGEIGELLVRGPQVMLGYWPLREQPAATANSAHKHAASNRSPSSPLPLQGERARVRGSSSDDDATQSDQATNSVEARPPHPPSGHLLPHGGEGTVSRGVEGTADGWLHTGDVARVTPDGLYQIVERKKDIIITSGFNVYPQEVEEVLKKHPSVKDAAVVGEPDDRRGEVVKAFVVLNDGATFDEQELMEFSHEHLSAHKRPKVIEHCKDDLPRSFLGKVIRRKLRK